MSSIKYRPEVDGLRAVAIAPVILFHAGSNIFSGGFVGVDVFFVISGFLITSIILKALEQDRFTIFDFYERRVRRIAPAYIAMAVVVTILSIWIVPPPLLKDYSESLFASLFFYSNIYFWRTVSYFDPAAEDNPLLHTWSLSVEEQFYVIFPLLALAVGASRISLLLGVSVVGAVASFALAQYASSLYAVANFYLTPTRAWELLVGVICAIYLKQREKAPRKLDADVLGGNRGEILALIGLGAILFSIFVYDSTTPFPSAYTLAPVLGAGMIILFARPKSWTTRLLSLPPLIGIGLISYSAYLWHQPIFAFYRLTARDEMSTLHSGLLILLVLGVSFLSWRFVETPFRRRDVVGTPQVMRSALAGMVVLVIAGGVISQQRGWPGRLSPEEQHVLSFLSYRERDPDGNWTRCFLGKGAGFSVEPECVSYEAGKNSIFFWGDSFSNSLQNGLDQDYHGRPVLRAAASECPPIFEYSWSRRPQCHLVNDNVKSVLTEFDGRIIMYANWRTYMRTRPNQERLVKSLRETIEWMRANDKDFVVVLSTPQWSTSLPMHSLKFADLQSGEVDLETRAPLLPELSRLDKMIVEQTGLRPNEWVSPMDVLCDDGETHVCLVSSPTPDGNHPDLFFWDYGHLTVTGARFLIESLGERLIPPPN